VESEKCLDFDDDTVYSKSLLISQFLDNSNKLIIIRKQQQGKNVSI